MARVLLEQENKDIHAMLKTLLAISGTNLLKVCEENGLDHKTIYNQTIAKKIDLDSLKFLISKIDPEAELSVDVSISLTANGKEIFNQKTEK